MIGYEKSVKKILKKHDWICIRSAKGSHEYWGKDVANPVSVPHNCKSTHTANAKLKAANINHYF